MGALTELLIDEPVLPGQRLDVLCQFSHLLGLQLRNLALRVELLPQVLAFTLEILDFLFSLEKLPHVIVLSAYCDTHLMLHVAELEDLLLELLLGLHQLLCLLVQVSLQVV